ncbi:hypothetical protein LTR37_009947 [Vermiconidia calcicola]|uniref:Uncharacterized protein n=1 Tax=Vermiconidia calcicola TaxID=1690605 RepID=A0ACC3N6B1_9PEZI|nr:hypothetical protein LTR37_009947 [Vermiconidia calcicola]
MAADPEMDEDLFADLYDGEADDPAPAAKEEPAHVAPEPEPMHQEQELEQFQTEAADDFNIKTEPNQGFEGMQNIQGFQNGQQDHTEEYDRPISIKEDGKMFIGGLNWETTDQSLKDYFSQFGEVVDCQVMRDGATGRSRGFGFLTFKNPKDVNIVMVKEHFLDGKLIDPKRAIPREEQERTAKIFVGGVSQECTDAEFREFFEAYGRVLDATLMMDKDTGRPRGFGFVTFDSDAAVDRTLEGPLAIHGKMIEVKRAEPRGNLRDGDGGGHGKFGGRHGKQNQGGQGPNQFYNDNQQNQMAAAQQNGGGNNMSPAMMAQYWQRMQQYFQMMQQQLQMSNGGGMNPMQAMQQNPAMMQQMMARQGMNPAMMQQMASMQGMNPAMMQQNSGMQSPGGGMQSPGSPMNGGTPQQQRPAFNAQEQLIFEQQKYERQQNVRMQQGNFQGGNTWDGMYDDVPAPAGMQGGNMRGGGFGGRGGRGGRGSSATPQPAGQAPANAPTGPKNAGIPGANYRGGGRGGRRGFHPYARGGGGM